MASYFAFGKLVRLSSRAYLKSDCPFVLQPRTSLYFIPRKYTIHSHSLAPTTWLITGCSSGFGAEFVRQLRAQGDNVIATGRNAATKLVHLKETGASILDLDVTSSEDIIAAKVAEAWDLYPGGIDVVVNNAGYILSGAFEEVT